MNCSPLIAAIKKQAQAQTQAQTQAQAQAAVAGDWPAGKDVPFKPDVGRGSLFTPYDVERGYVPKTIRGPFYDPMYSYYHSGIFPPGMAADPTRLSMQLGGLGGALGLAYSTYRRHGTGEPQPMLMHTGVGALGGGVLGYVLAKLINRMKTMRETKGITAPHTGGVFDPARWSYEPPPSPMNVPVQYGNMPQAFWNAAGNMVKRQSSKEIKSAQVLNALTAANTPYGFTSGMQDLEQAQQPWQTPQATSGHALAGIGSLLLGLATLTPWGKAMRALSVMSRMGRLGKTISPVASRIAPWKSRIMNWVGSKPVPAVSGATRRTTGLMNWGAGRGFRLSPGTEQQFSRWGRNIEDVGSHFSRPLPLAAALTLPGIGHGMVAGDQRWQARMAGLQQQLATEG
jgi:membrane protein YqaA with SNARE-associated domain